MKRMHMTRARAGILGGLLAAAMILLPAVPSTAKTAGPVITSFSPTEGWTTGGDTVVIKGSGLTNTSAVSIAGVPAQSFKVANDGEVDAVTKPAPDGTTGKVAVTTGSGKTAKTATSSASFLYTADVDPTDSCVDIAANQGPTITATQEFSGTIAVTHLGGLCPEASYTWVIKTPDGRPLTWVTDTNSGKTNCTTTQTATSLDQIWVTCTGSTASEFDLFGFFSPGASNPQLLVRAELSNPVSGQSDRWPEATSGTDWAGVCSGGGCGFGMT